MSQETFVDAGAWIAVSDARDQYHPAASAFYRHLLQARQTLVTTNLVVAEAYVVIRKAGGIQPALRFLDSLRQSSRLLKIYSDADLETRGQELLRTYSDHDFSLADAVSFAVMEQRGIAEAFAFDRHFLIAGFVLAPGL
jgi:predicted nucleic acid-binding protein